VNEETTNSRWQRRRQLAGQPRPSREILASAVGRSSLVTRRLYGVRVARLPEDVAPLRIAHLTDLHVGRVTPEARLLAAVEAANELDPDVVCLTGDYVAHSLRYLPRLTHCLRGLKRPAFATLGNHDYWQDGSAVRRALEAIGIHVLSNESTLIEVRGRRWRLVGVDDAVTNHHDLERAFSQCNGEPTVVLSHLAELAPACDAHGASLVLSGHTHGGQVRAAGVVDLVMRRMGHRYIMGWYAAGETAVYVNRGVGAAVFPWRSHHARAEVAGIDLGPGPGRGPRIRIVAAESDGAWPTPPAFGDDAATG
jgi:predicted MPP superfamily phosphohydrolase